MSSTSSSSSLGWSSSDYGAKHDNLKLLEQSDLGAGVSVPEFEGLSGERVWIQLCLQSKGLSTAWKALVDHIKQSGTQFLADKFVRRRLRDISKGVNRAFREKNIKGLFYSRHRSLISRVADEAGFLMVRSSMGEDLEGCPNAGGYESISYVRPREGEVLEAIRRVVLSAFQEPVLRRLAEAKRLSWRPELGILLQRLVGESPASTSTEIPPTSVVVFSRVFGTDSSNRIVQVESTFGHGEGVVGSHPNVGTDRYLLAEVGGKVRGFRAISRKEFRLAPRRQSNQQVRLLEEKNAARLRYASTLRNGQLWTLYTTAEKVEGCFEGRPVDIEAQCEGDESRLLQARVYQERRRPPIYIDLDSIPEESKGAILEPEEVLFAPGGIICLDGKSAIVCERLEDADRRYSGQDIIIVRQRENSTSHPMVNFARRGKPVIRVSDLSMVRRFLRGDHRGMKLWLCTQTGRLIYLRLNKAMLQRYCRRGYSRFPIAPEYSPSRCRFRPRERRERKEPPPSVTATLRVLKERNGEQAIRVVQRLRENEWVETFLEQAKEMPESYSPFIRLRTLAQEIEEALDDMEALLREDPPAEEIRKLFFFERLKRLLVGGGEETPSRFSLADVAFQRRCARKLLSVIPMLPEEISATDRHRLLDVATLGLHCPLSGLDRLWTNFLLKAVRDEEDLKPLETLAKLASELQRNDSLSFWVTVALPALLHNADYSTFCRRVQRDWQADGQAFSLAGNLDHKANRLERRIPELLKMTKIQAIGAEVQEIQLNVFAQKFVLDTYRNSRFAGKLALLSSFEALITVMDKAIKALKFSPSLSEEQRVELFYWGVRALNTIDALLALHYLGTDQLVFPKRDGRRNLLPKTYFDRIEECARLAAVIGGKKQFYPSERSAAGACIGSGALLGRHLPTVLEDVLPVVHKNAFAILSEGVRQLLFDQGAPALALWPSLKEYMAQAARYKLSLLNARVVNRRLTFRFCRPLRNHSMNLTVSVDRQGKPHTWEAEWYGSNWGDRWGRIAFFTRLLAEMGVIKLVGAPQAVFEGCVLRFRINREEFSSENGFQLLEVFCVHANRHESDREWELFRKLSDLLRDSSLERWVAAFNAMDTEGITSRDEYRVLKNTHQMLQSLVR